MNLNDKKIFDLQAQIAAKKEELKKDIKFSPKTNLILNLLGNNININALDITQLYLLKAQLQLYFDLIPEHIKISNYVINDWFYDVANKIEYMEYKAQIDDLSKKEKQLATWLSQDAQVSQSLDNFQI